MAELLIRCPDQPDQVLTLSAKPVSIGRSEDCDAFIAEKKASRKHLTLRVDKEGRIVAEDHDSSNGTWFVGDPEQRILRRVVVLGDTLRIGETTIAVQAGAAAEAPLVSGGLLSGKLQLTPSADAPSRRLPPARRLPSPHRVSRRRAKPDRVRRPWTARPSPAA
ncbi:MAG: FHA domain-containing protein [Planctomycetota bacterium]|nr:FHA domain-containing protein [Planctomycetota bacterium]